MGTQQDEILFGAAGRVLFMISSVKELPDPLWDEGLDVLEGMSKQNGGFDAAVVLSVSAAASAAQRRRLAERMHQIGLRSNAICLLSNSAFVRATVPALARLLRMGTKVNAFKTNAWRDGLHWLALTAEFRLEDAERVFLEACRRAKVEPRVIGA